MIICVMLIHDFGRDTIPYRKTLPATNKDPCIETHVIALEGKTEIQLRVFSGLMPAHTDIDGGAGCCGNERILTTTASW